VENSKLLGWRGRHHGDEGGDSREIQATRSCGEMGNAKSRGNGQLTTQQQGGYSIGGSMQEGADVSDPVSERPYISADEQIMEREGINKLQVKQSRDSSEMGNAPEPGSQIWGGLGVLEQESSISSNQGGKSTPTFEQSGDSCPEQSRQTQPSLGRNFDESSCGMGYAELYISCDPASKSGTSEGWGELDDPGMQEPHGIPDQQWQEDPTSWESGYSELCISCDNRTDELRLLGNGVVPATATLAFRTLLKELTNL